MKRDRIYVVEYQERWAGDSTWGKGTLHVLANGSVERAIAAAKKVRMADSFVDDKKGKTQRVVGFRLISVNVAATADIEG